MGFGRCHVTDEAWGSIGEVDGVNGNPVGAETPRLQATGYRSRWAGHGDASIDDESMWQKPWTING